LERFDFARILISPKCFDAINVVENILIDDKQYSIKFVEEAEAVFARDVYVEEEASDSVSECSEHFEELHNEEPLMISRRLGSTLLISKQQPLLLPLQLRKTAMF